MEQTQISLTEIYKKLLFLERIMQKINKHTEDLDFSRQTEAAYQKHEAGEFKVKSSKEFLKELKQG